MKFDLDTGDATYSIQSYSQDGISVNGETLNKSFAILPDNLIRDWPPRGFSDLKKEHFACVAELNPELVIIGCGEKHRFVDNALLQPLIELGVGVECMDSAAACRSYAILVAENRRVAACFLFSD